MTAREVTEALGGRWHGSYGTARCPAHEDDRRPSLSVTDGGGGGRLVKCHAGRDGRDCPRHAEGTAVFSATGANSPGRGCNQETEKSLEMTRLFRRDSLPAPRPRLRGNTSVLLRQVRNG